MKVKSGGLYRRIGVVALMVGSLIGAIAIPASASTGGHQGIVTVKHTLSASQKFTIARVPGRAPPQGVIGPNDIPPSGGCTSTVQGVVNSYYENGVLTDTVTPFTGDIHCIPSDPSQTMQHMSDQAMLLINGETRTRAELDECSHLVATDSPCVNLLSGTTGYCVQGAAVCDGLYSIEMDYTELLPDGWVWTSWPSTCITGGGNQEIFCKIYTDTVVVTPTL